MVQKTHGAADLPAQFWKQVLLPIGAAALAGVGLTGIALRSATGHADTIPGGLGLVTLVLVSAMVLATLFLACRLWRSAFELAQVLVELRATRAQAQNLAFHDPQTGLPNRARFDERLGDGLSRISVSGSLAVLVINLDRFKRVKNTLGQLAGDMLILKFAGRLSAVVASTDTVARIGEDEFVVLQSDIYSWSETEALCARIQEIMREPFDISGNPLFVGATVGVAFAPEYGTDRGELMRKANIALNCAREEGGGCHLFFAAAMDDTVKLRSQLEEGLREALSNGRELRVYYQPKLGPGGHDITGFEALVRWDHPKRGMITPEQFISVAEDTGLICQLGDWVLNEACRVALQWPDLFVAVNLSPVQFRSAGFADRMIDIVCASGCDPRSIELEVTEGILLDDEGACRATLAKLRCAGFRIALDDFGTGVSNLCYLRRFQVDKIKIDRSFSENIGEHVDPVAIVAAVVTLGHAMGLAVTAEGIETREQMGFLSAAGCNEFQGYLISPPLPEHELAELIASHEARCGSGDRPFVKGGAIDRGDRSRRAA